MMSFWDILLLSVALAMDCFAVSIVSGVILSRSQGVKKTRSQDHRLAGCLNLKQAFSPFIIRLSILFGLFQAMMPLVGWLATTWMAEYIEAYDHWIAFMLLAFLGGRMIRDAFRNDDEADDGQAGDDKASPRKKTLDPGSWRTDLLLAVATSIDALAVGISLAMTGYQTLQSLAMPLVVIGLGSFFFGVLGHWLGIRFGAVVRRRLQPELLGGIILIAIGVKILATHLAGG